MKKNITDKKIIRALALILSISVFITGCGMTDLYDKLSGKGKADDKKEEIGDPTALVPEGMLRQKKPALPEISQLQIVRHWTRLSEMTSATDNCIDFGLGTCTMKYLTPNTTL